MRRAIFSSCGLTGVQFSWTVTKQLRLADSFLVWEDESAYQSRGIASGGTRCIFVPEHMVSQLHPHSTCASIRMEELSPHASGINIYPLHACACVRLWKREESIPGGVCLSEQSVIFCVWYWHGWRRCAVCCISAILNPYFVTDTCEWL